MAENGYPPYTVVYKLFYGYNGGRGDRVPFGIIFIYKF